MIGAMIDKLSVARVEERHVYELLNDINLIACCQQGCPGAFDVLMQRHQRAVNSLLYQLAPDFADTSDLAQEVFIRIWRSLPTLRNPHAFKSWVNHLVTNLFYDELRKRPKNMMISMDEPIRSDDGEELMTRELPDHSALPDEMNQRRELSDAIDEAIAKLPDQFKTVIVLRDFEGLSYDEIAELTETEIGTVKSRIARARAKVQVSLSPFLHSAA